MPKLKTLSGKEVVSILEQFDFSVVKQTGSHVKLRRTVNNDIKQTLTIVLHDELDKGTLKAIFNQASRFVSEEELRKFFYTQDK